MINKFKVAVVVLLLCLLPISVWAVLQKIRSDMSKGAGEWASVYLNPAAVIMPPGVTERVTINSGTYEVAFWSVRLKFDPDKVKLTGEIVIPNPPPKPGDPGPAPAYTVIEKTSMASANMTGIAIISAAMSGEGKDYYGTGTWPTTGIFEIAQMPLGQATTQPNVSDTLYFVQGSMELWERNLTPGGDAIALTYTTTPANITVNPVTPSNTPIPSGPTATPRPTNTPTPKPSASPTPTLVPSPGCKGGDIVCRPAFASSGTNPYYAVDGDDNTFWSSTSAGTQWLYVDLGLSYEIMKANIKWGEAYSKYYYFEVSDNKSSWLPVWTVTNGTGKESLSIGGGSANGRYVRIRMIEGVASNYQLRSLEIYGQPFTISPTPPIPTPTPRTCRLWFFRWCLIHY